MTRHKKTVFLIFIISLMLFSTVYAAGGIKSASYSASKVYLYDMEIPLENRLISIVPEGSENASTYMPVRELLEILGYNVIWNDSDKSITIKLNGIEDISNVRQDGFESRKVSYAKSHGDYLFYAHAAKILIKDSNLIGVIRDIAMPKLDDKQYVDMSVIEDLTWLLTQFEGDDWRTLMSKTGEDGLSEATYNELKELMDAHGLNYYANPK